ncbi:MAG: UDP-N-acetylglucosamine--N-acetylmuramyl-(pentapeptide) pyrophosphoryl-undecaprenol N-acetylglucosamine transferase [Candidatus Limnocylindrales bacterium]
MRILIAAGGTGGHIYPALAVVTQLQTRRPDLELRWLGGRRGLESEIVAGTDIPLERLWLRSLRSVDASINTILDPLRLAMSVPQALWKLSRRRPDVVYTTGGYVAIPVLVAAALLRVPSLLWEGNQVPGRSVRVSARLATLRTVSYPATRERLPAPTFVTGTPIRDLGSRDKAAARARLGLTEELPMILGFGGSQAVRRLSDAVRDALPDVVERCYVVHITGEAAIGEAEALRATLPPARRDRYRPVAFLHEDMDAALTAADLLVGRAGSSTLAEAAAAGLPMIVVPYPHAAAHQKANASELVAAGAAVLVDDEDLDGDTLRRAAELLFDEGLEVMATAARGVGRPGAAAASARLLEALATRAPLPSDVELEALSRTGGGA